MTVYAPAPESIVKLGEEIQRKYHPDLNSVEVRYFVRDKASKSGGKLVMGQARKVSGLNALFAHSNEISSQDIDFFAIIIAEDTWDLLDQGQREALLDHELSHCCFGEDAKGEPVLQLISCDVEEFSGVLERHGLWHPGPELERFLKIGGQLSLFS